MADVFDETLAQRELVAIATAFGRLRRRVRALMPKLEALPGYRACEKRSREGDLDAYSLAWSLHGACDETVRDIRRLEVMLRRDARTTAAECAEIERRGREASAAASRTNRGAPPRWSAPVR